MKLKHFTMFDLCLKMAVPTGDGESKQPEAIHQSGP